METAVVRALRGHDAGRLYAVVRREGDFLLLADGKRRRLCRPKRKREKHTAFLGEGAAVPASGAEVTDAAVRRMLSAYRKSEAEAVRGDESHTRRRVRLG